METKKRKKMDSWFWFSVGYACTVEVGITLLLHMSGINSFEGFYTSFAISVIALYGMYSLRGE